MGAVARELLAFIWQIGLEAEREYDRNRIATAA